MLRGNNRKDQCKTGTRHKRTLQTSLKNYKQRSEKTEQSQRRRLLEKQKKQGCKNVEKKNLKMQKRRNAKAQEERVKKNIILEPQKCWKKSEGTLERKNTKTQFEWNAETH